MTRNENQMYSDVSSIAKSLEKIANALETNVPTTPKPKDIPGFEGTLDALDVLCDIKTITDDYANEKNDELHELVQDLGNNDYLEFCSIHNLNSNDAVAISNYIAELDYEECLGAIKEVENIVETNDRLLTPTSSNPDPAGYGKAMQDIYDNSTEDEYAYEYDLQGIRVDSDHDIRSTAKYYQECLALDSYENLNTKKDCILDYVTNEFGLHGARYTDIIKFAYYLGAHNSPKYSNSNRGYYSCAFNVRLNGHLIQGGKDFLVKGINNEGKERYFAHSSVDNFTGFYKRIS